ncbi:MAG: diaminopimelate epimerase [Muribaculaceae bacterium]|nr:diaminopimelate epimerase [Muribaculaceae bacterium]
MEERIKFVKMHGAGNDYVYIDAMNGLPADLPGLAREISDRHFGVGGDGLVVIMPSERGDFRMRMFNADGSEAQMCGNASRCVARYIHERGLSDKRRLTLETLAGIKVLTLGLDSAGKLESVTVDMGRPVLDPSAVPVRGEIAPEVGAVIPVMTCDGESYRAVAVGMGNPHCVIFLDGPLTDHHVHHVGKTFETHPCWPEKANVEFARVINPETVEMRVWERGTGETLACGTGACATVVAGILTGRLERRAEVRVPGGRLVIEWDEKSGHVLMTGPAETVAEGIYFRHSKSNHSQS